MNTLELQISQLWLPGFPFAAVAVKDPGRQLVHWLSDGISAAKAVIDVFLSMSPREEFVMTNMGWIMCACGLSIATRLDILATDPRISASTGHLRRLLSVRHTLKQVILRLESVASSHDQDYADEIPMSQLLRRAEGIEAWYLRQRGISSLSTPADAAKDDTPAYGHTPELTDLSVPTTHFHELSMAGAETLNREPQFDFSVMDIWDGMEMQGINFGPSLFTSDYQYFD